MPTSHDRRHKRPKRRQGPTFRQLWKKAKTSPELWKKAFLAPAVRPILARTHHHVEHPIPDLVVILPGRGWGESYFPRQHCRRRLRPNARRPTPTETATTAFCDRLDDGTQHPRTHLAAPGVQPTPLGRHSLRNQLSTCSDRMPQTAWRQKKWRQGSWPCLMACRPPRRSKTRS